jgi:hypothetical protein
MDSVNPSFNAKLYWRTILCRQFVDASEQSTSDTRVEELLAFFDQQPRSVLSSPPQWRDRKAA